jgi:hypothetical protein
MYISNNRLILKVAAKELIGFSEQFNFNFRFRVIRIW